MKDKDLKELKLSLIKTYQESLIKFRDIVIVKRPSIEKKLDNENICKFLTLMHEDRTKVDIKEYTKKLFKFRDLLLREVKLCEQSQIGSGGIIQEFIKLRYSLINDIRRYLKMICDDNIRQCVICGCDSIVSTLGDGYWLKENMFECGTLIRKESSYISGIDREVTYVCRCSTLGDRYDCDEYY